MKLRIPLALLALSLASVPAAAQCSPTFAAPPPNPYTFPLQPAYGSVTADFNLDGFLDLAIISPGVKVFRGVGDGTFLAPTSISIGGISSVATGDLNGDGRPDLAVGDSDFWGGGVIVLLANSDGSFIVGAPIVTTATLAGGVAIGDLNADGRADMAVTNWDDNTVSVLLGGAAPNQGTFLAPVSYVVGTHPTAVAIGDFNSDGRADLVVVNNGSNNISIRLGNAPPNAGTFSAGQTINTFTGPRAIVLGQFSADTRLDMAITSTAPDITFLRSSGVANFIGTDVPTGGSPYGITAGDFNNDGNLDLATSNSAASTVRILRGDGTGSFLPSVGAATTLPTIGIAAGDFNSDGRTDLAAHNVKLDPLLNSSDTQYIYPVITQQPPAASAVAAGAAASLSANGYAQGNHLQMRWRKNGVDLNNGGSISGATSPMLMISPALAGDAGTYDLRVTANGCAGPGTLGVTSTPAVLAVVGANPCAPAISQHPVTQSDTVNGQVYFSVVASSPPPGGTLAYQWRGSGINLVEDFNHHNVTTSTLTYNHALLADSGVVFDCVLTNACGTATSLGASVLVTQPPTCFVDINQNGAADISDIFGFLSRWFLGCP